MQYSFSKEQKDISIYTKKKIVYFFDVIDTLAQLK